MKDGLNCWCKKCHIKQQKIWKKENKDKIKEYCKKYKEHIKKYGKKYYQKNKKGWRIYRKNNIGRIRKNERERIRKNPKYRLDKNTATAIWFALKGKKVGKRWETLVDYTLQDLYQHLENQFDDKMTCQNYGSYWHLDHIVPKSWFPYQTAEEQSFKDCWALANLQPLEAISNLTKHNSYIL